MRHRTLWRVMVMGLCAGMVLLVAGWLSAGDIAALIVAYGWMMIGSSVFLGCGLAVQERIGRVAARTRSERPGTTIQGHRVF